MEIFNTSKSFPKEEKYSLTDQIRRSSRSIATNIAEGFRKRQYPKMFVSKLADADGEYLQRLKYGSTSPAIVNAFLPNIMPNSSEDMKKWAKCSVP